MDKKYNFSQSAGLTSHEESILLVKKVQISQNDGYHSFFQLYAFIFDLIGLPLPPKNKAFSMPMREIRPLSAYVNSKTITVIIAVRPQLLTRYFCFVVMRRSGMGCT